MSEPPTDRTRDKEKLPPPTRAQRLAAFGFLGAFGLTILTVLLTGLSVGAPSARHVLHPAPPAADTTVPSGRAGARSGASGGDQAAPRAAPRADEPVTDEVLREKAAHDVDDPAREHSRSDTREPQESRENDGR